MKKLTRFLICACAAICMAALAILTKRFPELFPSVITFPIAQLGYGLSLLAKAGPIGNGGAVALWVGISAIPAIFALGYRRGKDTLPERAALYVLSGAILLALYGTLNPRLFQAAPPESLPDNLEIIHAIFSVCVWAAVVLYVILRLIRLFRLGNKAQLLKYMQGILNVLCIFLAGAASLSVTDGVITLANQAQKAADAIFGAFRLAAVLIPYGFDIVIITGALKLLGIAGSETQEGIGEAAGRLSGICCWALGITTALTVASNLLQIGLMRWLTNISVTANIPIGSIAFTLMILLFSRLLVENKRLRDDNDLFI